MSPVAPRLMSTSGRRGRPHGFMAFRPVITGSVNVNAVDAQANGGLLRVLRDHRRAIVRAMNAKAAPGDGPVRIVIECYHDYWLRLIVLREAGDPRDETR